MKFFQVCSESERTTMAIAQQLTSVLKPGDIVVLEGTLAAGKTYFVKGAANALAYSGEVNSPTFSIANFYETPTVTIIHLDLYRIEGGEEFYDLGLDEYFPTSISFVEWGQKVADYLDDYLLISIQDGTETGSRVLDFLPQGDRFLSRMDTIKTALSQWIC